ncbi:hypothetical protein ACRALDRAFT_207430 [Sodiomyces alcalophilus JCM 7366]|uniref:uncharacterized protein n=1 Tax=Sodiomyces alcalophilus JCM 7366 TaxID=591952 RepID=UPI0039B5B5DE
MATIRPQVLRIFIPPHSLCLARFPQLRIYDDGPMGMAPGDPILADAVAYAPHLHDSPWPRRCTPCNYLHPTGLLFVTSDHPHHSTLHNGITWYCTPGDPVRSYLCIGDLRSQRPRIPKKAHARFQSLLETLEAGTREHLSTTTTYLLHHVGRINDSNATLDFPISLWILDR